MDAKEALRLQQENNFVILDVRPEADFKEVSLYFTSKFTTLITLQDQSTNKKIKYPFGLQAHPRGAINVQIYRLIKEWTAWDIARRAAFAFFGIFAGTEENPEFMQSILFFPNLNLVFCSTFCMVYDFRIN